VFVQPTLVVGIQSDIPLQVFLGTKEREEVRAQWLTPVILATWESEIRRIDFQGQAGQKVHKTPSQPMGAVA
jgi:hypothetical protein